MIRLLLLTSLLLTLLFGLILGGIRLQPQDGSPIMMTFGTPEDACTMPCWRGFQPGVTGRANALALLTSFDWELLTLPDCAELPLDHCSIFYLRNTADERQMTEIDVLREQVNVITLLNPAFTLGDALLVFGQPDRGTYQVDYDYVRRRYGRFYVWLWFNSFGISMRAHVTCPANFRDLLSAPITAAILQQPYAYAQTQPDEMRRLHLGFTTICSP